ncbi:MAG: hypothetical protein ACE5D7_10870, partial [Fidelibacterota bacterium]
QWTGSETIRFIVTDETDAALLGFQDVTFTIEPIDNPPEILAISDETVGKVRNFTSFDLDNYLVELDGDDVSWSFEYSTPVLGDPAPSWTINPNAFQFSMTVTAAVTVRNRITDNGDYILAAFSGGELRGVTSPVNVGNGWVYFLTLYSNVNSQPIEFSLYDPVIGDIIPVKETVIFEINGVVGNPDNPYVMNAGNILASLDADNIISFEILKESWYGTESIDFIVTDSGTLHAFSGTETASYTVLDDYYPIVLTIPDQIIEANNSFQEIDLANYLDSPDGDNVTWSYSGNNELLVNIAGSIATVTHPNQRTIVWTGTETITFIATDQTSNQLTGFSSATFTVVDIDDPPQLSGIPDQTVGPNLDFSSFDLTNYLTELNGDDVSWAYQFNIPNTGDNYPGWSVQASSYEMSATVTAVVNSRGLRAGAGNFQLGAFFGDEVRGAADPIQFGNDYLYFLTVFSNVSGQTITFKFYDALNGDVVPVNYSIDFVANAVLGNPQSPLELDAGNLLVDLSTDGVVQIQKVGTGWVGSEEIIFTVTDIGTPNLHSGSDAASFTVLPDNNPIVNQIPGQEIEVGTNFTDIDLSQYLTELDG